MSSGAAARSCSISSSAARSRPARLARQRPGQPDDDPVGLVLPRRRDDRSDGPGRGHRSAPAPRGATRACRTGPRERDRSGECRDRPRGCGSSGSRAYGGLGLFPGQGERIVERRPRSARRPARSPGSCPFRRRAASRPGHRSRPPRRPARRGPCSPRRRSRPSCRRRTRRGSRRRPSRGRRGPRA